MGQSRNRFEQWVEELPLLTKMLLFAVFAVLTIGALYALAGGGFGGGSSGVSADLRTPAYNLAAAQEGHNPAADDPLIARFDAQLNRLEGGTCREDGDQLAQVTMRSHDDLASHKVSESYLSVLTHVADTVPDGVQHFDCTGAFAAYLVLREQG